MARIEALMLDVDGVLVSGRTEAGAHWSAGLPSEFGLDPETLHEAFFASHWEDVVTGRALLRPRLAAALAGIAPHVGADRLIDYWFRNDACVNRDLLGEVARLRSGGMRVDLATNQEHERVRYLQETLGFAGLFDGCHYSAALGCRKPARAFFDAVADGIGIAPASLLLIDDSADNVAAAVAAGWQALRWTGDTGLLDLIGPQLAN